MTAFDDTLIELPTAAQPADISTTAVTVFALVQKHVDVEAQSNRKSELQVNCVDPGALSELESKAMLTLDPSLVNTADKRTGAGSGTYAGSILIELTPLVYITEY